MRRRSLLRLIALTAALTLAVFCAAAWAASVVWRVSQRGEDRAVHLSTYRWHEDAAWFGGLSALEVSENGMGFVALTDRGHLVAGRFWREAGAITSVELLRDERLTDTDGAPVTSKLEDSEGLAFGPGEVFYVSFESPHRVLEYSPTGVRELTAPKAFRAFRFNSSLEALARFDDGRLIAIGEAAPRAPETGRVWQWSEAAGWQSLGPYPEQDGFLPVGADMGPDCALYVLERKFPSVGFRSRLRRFEVTADGLTGGQLLLNSALAEYDNLEGLSIWQDESGALRATMISDDNFFWLQRTEIVEVRLPPWQR